MNAISTQWKRWLGAQKCLRSVSFVAKFEEQGALTAVGNLKDLSGCLPDVTEKCCPVTCCACLAAFAAFCCCAVWRWAVACAAACQAVACCLAMSALRATAASHSASPALADRSKAWMCALQHCSIMYLLKDCHLHSWTNATMDSCNHSFVQ